MLLAGYARRAGENAIVWPAGETEKSVIARCEPSRTAGTASVAVEHERLPAQHALDRSIGRGRRRPRRLLDARAETTQLRAQTGHGAVHVFLHALDHRHRVLEDVAHE